MSSGGRRIFSRITGIPVVHKGLLERCSRLGAHKGIELLKDCGSVGHYPGCRRSPWNTAPYRCEFSTNGNSEEGGFISPFFSFVFIPRRKVSTAISNSGTLLQTKIKLKM